MRRGAGFTLAEVIMACGILSVVVVMVTNLLPGAVLLLRGSEHRLQATRIIHRGLETARSTPLQQLLLHPLVQSQEGIFQIQTAVTAVAGVPADKLAQIQVRVKWSEFDRSRSIEMLTYVSSLSQ